MQVKILSLNASVEAARADQYGARFAVVAQEISKLSENTSQVVNPIEHSVGDTPASVGDTVKDMDNAKPIGARLDAPLDQRMEAAKT